MNKKFLNILENFINNYRLKPDNNGNIIIKGINNTITELPFLPKYVSGKFDVSNAWLETLEGSREIVNGNFNCSHNYITSLIYAPKVVLGNYNCGDNKLSSLKGSPEIVNGNYDCWLNELETLENGPRIVKGNYDCSTNDLISFKGSPEEIGGDFICNNCGNISLKYCTKNIGGKLYYNKKTKDCIYSIDKDLELKNFKEEVIKYQIKAKKYIGDNCFFSFEDIEKEFEEEGLKIKKRKRIKKLLRFKNFCEK